MTRAEIDAMHTPPAFNMGEVYGKVLSLMFTTCFYAPLLPIILFYTLCGLGFYYWVVKVIFYIKVYFIKKKKC